MIGLLRICLVMLAVMAQPARAEILGHWIHPKEIMVRSSWPIEELVITEAEAGGHAFAIYGHYPTTDCEDQPYSPHICMAVVLTHRGSIDLDPVAGRLGLRDVEALDELGPERSFRWSPADLAGGSDWDLRFEGTSFTVTRDVAHADLVALGHRFLAQRLGPDKALEVSKRFYRVPEGFAADLAVLSLGGTHYNLPCVIASLAARPDILEEVVGRATPAAAGRRQLEAEVAKGQALARASVPVDPERYKHIMIYMEQIFIDPAAPIVAPEGFAPETWQAMVDLGRFQRHHPDGKVLIFPEALPMRDEIVACQERLFDAAP